VSFLGFFLQCAGESSQHVEIKPSHTTYSTSIPNPVDSIAVIKYYVSLVQFQSDIAGIRMFSFVSFFPRSVETHARKVGLFTLSQNDTVKR